MSDGEVRYVRNGAVATVTFDRPAARNAMTWRMYEQLAEACARMQGEEGLRAAVFRGAGGKAFIAGTDIAQFRTFNSGDDGLAYEAKMEGYLSAIEALSIPTLAVIEGFAIGGGLAIAACCDLRIATPGARFGVPTARTLGNCLSIANYARLVAALGASRAKRVMLSRRMTTSFPYSTRRFAFSMTISLTWTCREAGSSKVELTTSACGPLTVRSISVTSSGRSSIRSTMR